MAKNRITETAIEEFSSWPSKKLGGWKKESGKRNEK